MNKINYKLLAEQLQSKIFNLENQIKKLDENMSSYGLYVHNEKNVGNEILSYSNPFYTSPQFSSMYGGGGGPNTWGEFQPPELCEPGICPIKIKPGWRANEMDDGPAPRPPLANQPQGAEEFEGSAPRTPPAPPPNRPRGADEFEGSAPRTPTIPPNRPRGADGFEGSAPRTPTIPPNRPRGADGFEGSAPRTPTVPPNRPRGADGFEGSAPRGPLPPKPNRPRGAERAEDPVFFPPETGPEFGVYDPYTDNVSFTKTEPRGYTPSKSSMFYVHGSTTHYNYFGEE